MKRFKVKDVKYVTGVYDNGEKYMTADYEVVLVEENTKEVVEILLPQAYFGKMQMIEGEFYVTQLEDAFEDWYGNMIYCYSLTCGEKRFTLYYDEPFKELEGGEEE